MADGPWNDFQQSPKQSAGPWDDFAQAKPVAAPGGSDASGTKGGGGAPQPTAAQLGYSPTAKGYSVDSDALANARSRPLTADNLTSGYDPGAADKGLATRALSGIGGAVMGAPGAIYHAVKDPLTPEEEADFKGHTRIPGEVTAERLLGARQIVEGGKQWADPKTRPSWEGVKSVAPEALGGALGNYIVGEMSGKIAEHTPSVIMDTVKSVPAIGDVIKDIGRSYRRKVGIDQAITRTYNDNVQTPIETYRGVVQRNVAAHAQAIDKADVAFNKQRGINGAIDTTDAATEMEDTLKRVGKSNPAIENIRNSLVGQIPFNEAKNLLTQIGNEASKAKYTGDKALGSSLWGGYEKLLNSVSDHVDSLGQPFKKSFDLYRNDHRTLMEQSALLNDLAYADTPQKGLNNFLDAMTDTKGKGRQNQIDALRKDMKTYNVDSKPFDAASSIGGRLRELTNTEGNIIISKYKLMVRHWATALPAGIATMGAASAMGLGPLGHIILPLLIAGKVAGAMDNIGIAKVLREVNATTRETSGMAFKNKMMGPNKPPAVPADMGPPQGGGGPAPREATPGEADDMATAQDSEESRQAMAHKVKRTRSVYRGKR